MRGEGKGAGKEEVERMGGIKVKKRDGKERGRKKSRWLRGGGEW